jgi:hypothetical protein
MVPGDPDRGRLRETVSPIDHGQSMSLSGKGISLSLRRMTMLSQGSGSPPACVMYATSPRTVRLKRVELAGAGARNVVYAKVPMMMIQRTMIA